MTGISLYQSNFSFKKYIICGKEFPGGLVIRIRYFHQWGRGSLLSLGTEIPQQATACYGQKKKKKKKYTIYNCLCFINCWLATHFTSESGHSCLTSDDSWGIKGPSWLKPPHPSSECFCRSRSLIADTQRAPHITPLCKETSLLRRLPRNQRRVLCRIDAVTW